MDIDLEHVNIDKLLELQEKCEICKKMTIHEEAAGTQLGIRCVCEKCNKVC
jgi:hypothetical protein